MAMFIVMAMIIIITVVIIIIIVITFVTCVYVVSQSIFFTTFDNHYIVSYNKLPSQRVICRNKSL